MKSDQYTTLDTINAFWLKNIKTFIQKIIKNSPYYRSLGINKIESFEDFEKLPILDSETLRNTPIDELRADKWENIVGITRSSGTTGKSKNVLWTEAAINWDKKWGKIFFSHLNLTEKDRLLLMMPLELTRIGGWADILYELGVFTIPLGRIRNSVDAENAVTKAIELKPTILCGSPNRIFTFTQDILKTGITPKEYFKVKKILTGGTTITQKMKQFLESIWDCEIYDVSGANEVSFLGFECSYHNGMHLLPGPNYVEVVDDNNKKITNGDEGTILITNYNNLGTPLLRYSVGDVGSILYEPCQCGLVYPRLKIKGRNTGTITLGGTKLHSSDIEEVISQFDFLSNAYQVIVKKKNDIDFVHFYIETSIDISNIDPLIKQDIKEKLSKSSYSIYDKLINNTVSFEVTLVNKEFLERSETDKVKNQFQDLR